VTYINNFYRLYVDVRVEKTFSYPLRFSASVLKIQLTKEARISRRKHVNFIDAKNFLFIGASQKRIENSKEWLVLCGVDTILMKSGKCGEVTRQRKESWFLGLKSVKETSKMNKWKGRLILRLVHTDPFWS
jgi:hypothetical protein